MLVVLLVFPFLLLLVGIYIAAGVTAL